MAKKATIINERVLIWPSKTTVTLTDKRVRLPAIAIDSYRNLFN